MFNHGYLQQTQVTSKVTTDLPETAQHVRPLTVHAAKYVLLDGAAHSSV